MRTIAVMNQKGGVGKTTTSVNLAAGLSKRGQRVLLIDLDPQGHSSLHLGIEAMPDTITVYDVFTDGAEIAKVRRMVGSNLWLLPSNIDLAAAELELIDAPGRETKLRQAIEQLQGVEEYDYVIMDCPPSLGVLTINALTAAKEVFIPLQPHFFALQGLSKLLETTALVTRRLNRELRVTGVVLCLYETGTRLAADVTDDLVTFLKQSDSQAPWAKAQIFNSRIRRNIKLAEAPSFGQSIFDYDAKCPGSQDYFGLVDEVLAAGALANVPPATVAAGTGQPAAAASAEPVANEAVVAQIGPQQPAESQFRAA